MLWELFTDPTDLLPRNKNSLYRKETKMKYEKNKIVYEIGDWVYVTERLADNCTKVGDVGLLTHLDISSNSPYCVNNSWCKDVRPATQQEVDKAIKERPIM